MNDIKSTADIKAALTQILTHLEESQAAFAGVKSSLEEGAAQLRTAADGSFRSDGTDAAGVFARSAADAEEVLSELASAAKEAEEYRNFV